MTDEKCSICRLCLQVINDNIVYPLENVANIIQSILPRLNVNISSNPVVCSECNELLQKSYKNKLSCLESDIKLYVVEKGNFESSGDAQEQIVTDSRSCVFCLQIVCKENCRKLSKLENGILETCIPERDISFFQNIDICEVCLDGLYIQYNFIKRCSCVEEEIDSYCKFQGADTQIDLRNVHKLSINTETFFNIPQIKKEEVDDLQSAQNLAEFNDSIYENTLPNEEIFIKDECNVYDASLEIGRQTNVILKTESQQVCTTVKTNKRKSKRSFHESANKKIELECTECTYLTIDKHLFARHLMVHKDSSELRMYKCNECSYQSKFKSNLTKHTVVHKGPTELDMFKCTRCKYQAKRKKELRIHMLVHTDPSELNMYKCNECDYQTKHKSGLIKHVLVHNDNKELMHRCPHCSYMSRQKSALNQHMLLHKKPEDITYHKCSQCPFKSIYKSSLVKHSLVHKNPNEVDMYECDICSLATRTKMDLKAHMVTHGKEFKCNECFFETKFKSIFTEHVMEHETAG